MVDIGERLKYIRETYDVSQEQLANYLNISKSSISHYENNDRDIPMRNLSEISNFFELSIDYILDFTKRKNYPNSRKNLDLKIAKDRIKEICEDRQYSNVKLAKELNTTESNIRKYKTGQTLILTAFALQLSLNYDYSMDWIIGKSDQKLLDKAKIKIP